MQGPGSQAKELFIFEGKRQQTMYDPLAKSNLPPASVSKVVLEYSYTH